MSKEIHYTLNGAVPTINSTKYTAFFVLTHSTKIRSVKVDTATNEISVPIDSYIGVGMPGNLYTQKYYLCHLMVDLGGFAGTQDDTNAWIVRVKAQGYNLLWLHLENYSATDSTFSYNTSLLKLMNACDFAGIKFMAGISYGGASLDQKVRLFQDTWNHPAILKIEGKRVYTDYYSFPFLYTSLAAALTPLGMSDYYYISGTLFPTNNNGVDSNWNDEAPSGDGNYDSWTYSSGAGTDSIEHVYETRPFDGIVTFNAGANAQLRETSNKMFRFGFGDNIHFYNSFAFSDTGFSGSAANWDEILAHAPIDRLQGVCDITANDMIEATYMAETCVPPEDGLSYVPKLGSGFNLGSHMKYPMPDHSGMQYFLRPWIDAFLNNQTTPTFSTNRIFCRHTLHPVHAVPRTAVPYALLNESYITQTYWNDYFYANPLGYTPVNLFIYHQDTTEPIKMAVHLTAPAILKINNTSSSIQQAGPAYFEIPLGNFLGTPYFAILEADGVTVRKEGYSQQAIVPDCWPGGWGLLAQEINPNNLPTPIPPTLVCDNTANTITASHTLGNTEIEYSLGYTEWLQYTGVISIGDINLEAGFYRVRIKSNEARNSSPSVLSEAFTGTYELGHIDGEEFIVWNQLLTTGVVDNGNGSFTATGSTYPVGATASKKLGGSGSWIQFTYVSGLYPQIKITDTKIADHYTGIGSDNAPTFTFHDQQFNPPGAPYGYLTGGETMRLTVANNGVDMLVAKSYSNGKRFLPSVLVTGVLTGMTEKYIQVYGQYQVTSGVFGPFKGFGLVD